METRTYALKIFNALLKENPRLTSAKEKEVITNNVLHFWYTYVALYQCLIFQTQNIRKYLAYSS